VLSPATACTITSSLWPVSELVAVYVAEVAFAMGAQMRPFACQRCHP
jgi:hypothetical protein